MKAIKLIALALFSTAFLSFTPLQKKHIVIDAGHGGNDMGAVYGNVSEKDIVLNIAKEIQKISETQDQYEVILTRDSDDSKTLGDRTARIAELNPEIVISLHVNSSPQKENVNEGQELFVQNTEGSKKLAEKISKKFDVRKTMERDLRILRETKSPTVLIELGFINNTKEREYITSEKGQKEVAQKLIEVIKEY